jgi:magnesium-transporting ATPase (P-type)
MKGRESELTSPINPLHEQEDQRAHTKSYDASNDITEHMLSHDQIAQIFKVDFQTGLTESEAARRLQENGPNALTPPKRTPLWLKFLHHLIGGFAILLWVGSILCFVVYAIDGGVENLTLGVVLAAVVVITGVFSFYQEFKSDGIMAGFLKLAATECDVFRESKYRYVSVCVTSSSYSFPVHTIVDRSIGASQLTKWSLAMLCGSKKDSRSQLMSSS